MKWKKYIPDRKVLSSGLVGVVGFLATLGLNAAGVAVDYETVMPIIIVAASLVAYFVPPSALDIARKLNDDIIEFGVGLEESAATYEGAYQAALKDPALNRPERASDGRSG
ncbi:hypothetical protein [Nisaea sediminum]|uniref:hypothetical protein n=1 Tax=Nisaea sediminum TaxID=2775867 RepID=UPI00186851B2|nr:hypothetical protein [Nisaea sediminum]